MNAQLGAVPGVGHTGPWLKQHPIHDLVTYALGITLDLLGFARARITPRPGALRELAEAVPPPHGLIEVRISGT